MLHRGVDRILSMRKRFATRSDAGPAIDRVAPLSLFADVMVFLVGFATQYSIHFVGDLPVAELFVLFFGLPMLILYRHRVLRRDLLWVYVLMGLWLLNQIITDAYRETPRADWLRGDAAIVFFAFDLAFISMAIGGSQRRKLLMVGGIIVGSLAAVRLAPTEFSTEYPWKFGYAMGVNLTVVLLSGYFYNRKRYFTVLMMLLGISAVNLALNFRSPVLLILLTISLVVPVVPERIGLWRVLPPEGTRMRLVVLTGLAFAASSAAGGLVNLVTAHGYIGEDAQRKNEQQQNIQGGILLGGRPEILVSSVAVFDSPILGHGSWAKDFKYVELLNDTLFERGAQADDIDALEGQGAGLIPAHSHLMGSWVWAGIMGAVFWGYLLWITVRAITHAAMQRRAFGVLYGYLFVTMTWDILFAPFGSSRRMVESTVLIIAIDLIRESGPALMRVRAKTGRAWRRGSLQPRYATSTAVPTRPSGGWPQG